MMSNNGFTQITFDTGLEPVSIEQIAFDYRFLSADKREFVMQKTDETQWLLKKTAENIIKIGQNLREVKNVLDHGQFLPWLRSEFGLSQQTASNFVHVAERFEGKLLNFSNLSVSALYALSSPSTPDEAIDEALKRAESGEKITHALAKKIIDAQVAIEEAKNAEAQAKADAIAAVELKLKTEQDAANKEAQLASQIETLRQEMAKLVKPEVQIHEVEKIVEVLPQGKADEIASKTEQLAKLQAELEKVKNDRDNESARAESFAQKFREELTTPKIDEHGEHIRQRWRSLMAEFHLNMMQTFSQLPTTLDTQSFDPEDWMRLSDSAALARRFIEACDHLSSAPKSMIIDAG